MKFIVSSSALFNRLQTIGRVKNFKEYAPPSWIASYLKSKIIAPTVGIRQRNDADYQFGTRGKRRQYPFLHQRQTIRTP